MKDKIKNLPWTQIITHITGIIIAIITNKKKIKNNVQDKQITDNEPCN